MTARPATHPSPPRKRGPIRRRPRLRHPSFRRKPESTTHLHTRRPWEGASRVLLTSQPAWQRTPLSLPVSPVSPHPSPPRKRGPIRRRPPLLPPSFRRKPESTNHEHTKRPWEGARQALLSSQPAAQSPPLSLFPAHPPRFGSGARVGSPPRRSAFASSAKRNGAGHGAPTTRAE